MTKEDLPKRKTFNGHTFKLNDDKEFYECRGSLCYDDEHDEIPEASLWKAAKQLTKHLEGLGFKEADYEHSEKGWVEVWVENP